MSGVDTVLCGFIYFLLYSRYNNNEFDRVRQYLLLLSTNRSLPSEWLDFATSAMWLLQSN